MLTEKPVPSFNLFKLYGLFAVVILIWGFSWPISKIGMSYIPPIWFAAFRLIIATVSMFLLVGSLRKLVIPSKQDLPLILSLGIFQMGLFTMFINWGLFYVAAGRSAILTYTTPFWVLPIAVLVFKEKISLLTFVGFILGMLGIVILFSPQSLDWSNPEQLLGNGLLLLAALSFAVAMLCARNMTWRRSALELLPWQLLVGTIPVLLLAIIQTPSPEIQLNMTAISTLTYTAILGTAIAYWCSTIISKELPSTTVSIGFLGVPICGFVFSTLILHEPITTAIKLAMIFVPAGLFCVALGKK